MTNSYYDQHGQQFAKATADLEVGSLHQVFLEHIPASGHILDAGCGSGRDSRAFMELGYKVTAIDASTEMVDIASKITGINVLKLSFQEIEFQNTFDGIWACASLLHVPSNEMNRVLERLCRALKDGGILYMSFKYGTLEGDRNGRLFNDYDEDKLTKLMCHHTQLKLTKMWVTPDIRPERAAEMWLNALAAKQQ